MSESRSGASGSIWTEVQAERERAHAKHGATSMEALAVTDLTRLTVLMEEVGEVAREFNEARHFGRLDHAALRKELVQVTAMAGAWADALGPQVRAEAEALRLRSCADCPHESDDHIFADGQGCYSCGCDGWRPPANGDAGWPCPRCRSTEPGLQDCFCARWPALPSGDYSGASS